jgi:hypothetical protein
MVSSLADPELQCCWASAAHVFVREIAQMESWSPAASNELGSHVGTITTALSRLSMTFPLAGMVPINDGLSLPRVAYHIVLQASWPHDFNHHSAWLDLAYIIDNCHEKTLARAIYLNIHASIYFYVSILPTRTGM